MAWVYLIHLDHKLAGHAGHYIGYCAAENPEGRLARHKAGNGSRMLRAANKKGISYRIVKTWKCKDWKEARKLERKLKSLKNAPRICPICNQKGS